MKKTGVVLFALMISLLGKVLAEPLQLTEAWVRLVPPGQPNSAMYFTLQNTSAEPRILVAIESDSAKYVELHTHHHHDGRAQMRQLEQLEIPAGETILLQPSGLHIMLIDLLVPLQEGQKIAFNLLFADGTGLPGEATVRTRSSMQPAPELDVFHDAH